MPKIKIDLAKVVDYLKENAGKKHIYEMCNELNLSFSFVQKVAKSQGIDTSLTRSRSKQYQDSIKEMHEAGMSLYEISKALGIHYNSAVYHAFKAGLHIVSVSNNMNTTTPKEQTGYFNVRARENWLI
jgi:hypothetical protein